MWERLQKEKERQDPASKERPDPASKMLQMLRTLQILQMIAILQKKSNE